MTAWSEIIVRSVLVLGCCAVNLPPGMDTDQVPVLTPQPWLVNRGPTNRSFVPRPVTYEDRCGYMIANRVYSLQLFLRGHLQRLYQKLYQPWTERSCEGH